MADFYILKLTYGNNTETYAMRQVVKHDHEANGFTDHATKHFKKKYNIPENTEIEKGHFAKLQSDTTNCIVLDSNGNETNTPKPSSAQNNTITNYDPLKSLKRNR